MKHLLTLAALSLSTLPAWAALQPGNAAPDFTARASLAGKEFNYSLNEALSKGPVVVYFYPSAYTGGCNLQAHTYAINKEKFDAAGASIVGVSLDSIERLNDFSADPEYCAGKIPVASDADGKIARAYALEIRPAVEGRKDTRGIDINHGFSERTTFLIDQQGHIVTTIGGLTAAENVDATLRAIEQLHLSVRDK